VPRPQKRYATVSVLAIVCSRGNQYLTIGEGGNLHFRGLTIFE
jgi:hypothetical protein